MEPYAALDGAPSLGTLESGSPARGTGRLRRLSVAHGTRRRVPHPRPSRTASRAGMVLRLRPR